MTLPFTDPLAVLDLCTSTHCLNAFYSDSTEILKCSSSLLLKEVNPK